MADLTFRTITGVDGVPINVAVQGNGPLVLMVHGFPECWYSWRHQLPRIAAEGFTAVAMDLRGYGASGKPQDVAAYQLTAMVGDIVAVIDAFDPSGAVLVGHDWGALIVYATCLMQPQKVRAVAGLATPPGEFVDLSAPQIWADIYGDGFFYQRYFNQPGVAEAEFERDPARFLSSFYHAMSGDFTGEGNILWDHAPRDSLAGRYPMLADSVAWMTPDDMDYYVTAFRAGGIAGPLNRYRNYESDRQQLRPYASHRIMAPALFIAGLSDKGRFLFPGRDRFAGPDTTPRFANRIGAAHLLTGVGHWVQQEAARQVNDILCAFLRHVGPATTARSKPVTQRG